MGGSSWFEWFESDEGLLDVVFFITGPSAALVVNFVELVEPTVPLEPAEPPLGRPTLSATLVLTPNCEGNETVGEVPLLWLLESSELIDGVGDGDLR